MLVPILMTTETPIAERNNMGSIHDVVDKINIIIITGSKIVTASPTSATAAFFISLRFAASPAIDPPEPIILRIAAMASDSAPSLMVTENNALWSL